jgi:hypothetical protein
MGHSNNDIILDEGVDDAPIDETPMNDAPIDETPMDETPMDEAPMDEAPIDNKDRQHGKVSIAENSEIKINQIEEFHIEELPEKVATIEEAAIQYNKPEYITRSVSNLAYFCRACNKQLKFGSTKPIAHCKTTGHNKKFLQWVNKNNLIMH